MKKITRSHFRNGQAYYKFTGRWNEVTKSAIARFPGSGTSSLKQKNLTKAGKNSAASITTRKVLKELGW